MNEALSAQGEEAIEKYRPELSELHTAFVFRGEAAKFKAKTVAAPEFRRALLHHEICHDVPEMSSAGIDTDEKSGRKKAKVIAHDVEEFAEAIEEHGANHASLREILRTFDPSRGGGKTKSFLHFSRRSPWRIFSGVIGRL